MAYTSGDSILDTHYNDFATSVNALWGTGSGNAGYGNGTTVAAVSDGTTIQATQWSTLLARITSIGSHTGTSLTSITSPSGGDSVAAFTALAANITAITNGRLSGPHARLSNAVTNVDNTTALTGTITQTLRYTWSSADTMRYFFNLGGRINVSWSLTGDSNTSKSDDWQTLATACGTFQITNGDSGKSGGSGSANVNGVGGATSNGWENITGSAVACFKQFAAAYAAYNSNFINLTVLKTGAYVEATSTWVDAASETTNWTKSIYNVRDTVDGTKRTAFGYEKHNATHIADNGGSITMNNTVNSHA
jgi:hypothetical protein